MQPKMLLYVHGSFNIRIPSITLVIGSNIHKIAVVVGPIFFTPICIKVIAITEVNMLTINEYVHAVPVKASVKLPVISAIIKSTIDAKIQE